MKSILTKQIVLSLLFVVVTLSAESPILRLLKQINAGETKPTLTILARMSPAQMRYVQHEIFRSFEKRYNCKVRLETYKSSVEISRILELDARRTKPQMSLVLTPLELSEELVSKELLLPLKEILDEEKIEAHMSDYHPLFKAMGVYDSSYYFVPRMVETQMLFYRKSKVADAVTKFEKHRATLQQSLEKLNGFGLPRGYTLEADPNEWDFYDLFTVGYIWSQEEYAGRKFGRISHRSDAYAGTALHLIDRAFQLGANKDEVLALRGRAVSEMFLWEQVFAQEGIYDKESYQSLWRGSDLYRAIKDDRCFLTWFSPIEFGRVHGWADDPMMKSYLKDPSDMGVAIIPKAVSFSLDEKGEPIIEGSRNITLRGSYWGVPKSAPEAELAFQFATYITNRTWNASESSNFCMLPVRKDLLLNLADVYAMGWIGDIYKTAVTQIKGQVKDSITVVPRSPKFSQIAEQYTKTYLDIVMKRGVPIPTDVKSIERHLGERIEPKVRAILGDKYPAGE